MQPCRRSANVRARSHRGYFHAWIALPLLLSLLLPVVMPSVAHAQTPNSFWIPPYRPHAVPPVVDGEAASLEEATALPVLEDLRLIVDTDPGVDDAVALAWLLTVLDVEQVAGIVTVAGNTTVENATANVYSILAQMGDPDVTVVTGARTPLLRKLSSSGKLIHGQDGLWGQQMAQAAWWFRNRDARNFYCEQAKSNPETTILAIGPLTNLAEAVLQCRRDMRKVAQVVILGGAKAGGNTTPVAEFNFWQDPEAAKIVFESGMKIDLVPLDSFNQLAFTPLEVFGYAGNPDSEPPIPPIPSVFAGSELPVFQYLALPASVYAQTQLLGGVAQPAFPDLTAAFFAVYGDAVLPVVTGVQPLQSALVEIIAGPDAVRGQSIIGLGFNEKLTMIATNEELDALAEGAFPPGSDFPDFAGLVFPKIFEILLREPDNANMVTLFDVETMRAEFLGDLAATVATTNATVVGEEQIVLPESLFLPSVTSE